MQEYRRLLSDITQGRIAPVYLLAGVETYLHRQLLDRLAKVYLPEGAGDYNYELFDGDTVDLAAVIDAANVLPMFGARKLVVVRNAPWFGGGGAPQEEMLLAYLKEPSPYACLVFLARGKPDGRRKVVKELAKVGVVWESSPLEGADLAAFVKEWLAERGKVAGSGALELIVAGYAGDLELLVRELEKLCLYLGENKTVTAKDIEEVMVLPEQHSIFALTDAVSARDGVKALWLLKKMLQAGEQPVSIIGMLAWQLRLILHGRALAERGYSPQQIAEKMRAGLFPVKKALAQARNFRQEELVAAMTRLLETDVALKRGQGEPAALLEQAIMELCAKN